MVGIHTGPDTYLDHLGVLCSLLEIPLWVTEEKTFASAQKYYPQLNVELKDYLDLSLEYMAQNCDAILESGHYWATELIPLFDRLFRKKMRIIYCPHGNSDKGHSLQTPLKKDIALVYGQHMIDLLQRTGCLQLLSAFALTGNYRYAFYRKNRDFYDQLAPKTDPKKKTILYAPTWADGESTSSFFSSCAKLIEEALPFFNLIIKLHPFLEEHHPAEVHRAVQKYPSATFLTEFPAIYPLLNIADGYIGDFSSVGYDYLAFNRPMFFFHPGPLSACGIVVPEKTNYGKFLLEHWDQQSQSISRQQAYSYAFGEEKSVDEIKKGIEKALSSERAY
jgi:CDP-glycerol glycerophosphotransferase (TagB/SpsB family)